MNPLRYCLEYERGGSARWLSRLDLQVAWERALRRVSAPLAYTQGAQARVRFHFQDPLPLGVAVECERFWVDLVGSYPTATLADRLARTLPSGFSLRRVFLDPQGPRAEQVRRVEVVGADPPPPDAEERLGDLVTGRPENPPALTWHYEPTARTLSVLLRGNPPPSLRRALARLMGVEAWSPSWDVRCLQPRPEDEIHA